MVASTWRYQASEKVLTISAFSRLTKAQRQLAEQSACRITGATAHEDPAVVFT